MYNIHCIYIYIYYIEFSKKNPAEHIQTTALPVKIIYLENLMLETMNCAMNARLNGCVKSSSQLQVEHCMCSSDFFPSECPGLCST